jgi:Protein of unknown function (DUF4232)
MNLRTYAMRRILAAGVASAAILMPTAAVASPGSPSGPGQAGPAACATPKLDIWLNTAGSGAAGTIYYDLKFTNLSGSTCTLLGFPGVSGVNLSGTQLGSAASRNHAFTPHTVTLANGATATAKVGIVQVSLFQPSQCHPVTAAGLRVFPPGQTASKVVPFPFGACSHSGPVYLTITTVRP